MGAHGNVGGGCYSDLLVDIPFKWIIGKAELHGLNFRETVEIEPAACEAKIYNSFREFLFGIPYFVRLGIRYHRRTGARPKAVEENQIEYAIDETLDASVFERWRCNDSYRSRNLKKWARPTMSTLTIFEQAFGRMIPPKPSDGSCVLAVSIIRAAKECTGEQTRRSRQG